MKQFKNINPDFGNSGPYPSESKEKLADDMNEIFVDWAFQKLVEEKIQRGDIPEEIKQMRLKFIEGLVEV